MMKSYLNSEKMNRFLNFTLFTPGKLSLAIIVFVVALFSNNLSAQTTETFTSTGSSTWTVPCGVTSITVEVWGGGGRGATLTSNLLGGGGGGGAYSRKTFNVVAGDIYTLYVGAGSNTSSSGGESYIYLVSGTKLCLANGGSSVGNSSNGANGGSANSGIGDVKFSGGKGANGSGSSSGGGGSSAGTSAIGGDASGSTGGIAPAGGGNGANGRTGQGNGTSATEVGGGGSGGLRTSSNTRTGGKGGNGQIKITYTAPAGNTATLSSVTGTNNQTVCINTDLTNITYTTTGATGIGTAISLPAGVTAAWASNTITISGTPTASGIFSYSIPLTGGCSSINATGTITVSPASVGGTVTGGSTICSGSTSAVLTLSGHTGTITKWQSSVSPFTTWTDIVNTSSTYTSGTLTATTQFRAVVTSGSCSSATSAVTTVTVNLSVAGTVSADQTICTGNSASVSLSGYTGSIQWQKSSNGTSSWSSVSGGSGSTAATYNTPNLSSTMYYRAVVTSGGCTSATSAVVKVTVLTNAAPDISFQQNNDDNAETIDLCGQIGGGGQNDIDINSGTIAGATYQWEYSTVSATGPWTVDSYTGEQFNIASFSHTPGTYYFRVLRTYGCSVYSDVITLTVRNSGTLPVFTVQGNSSCTDGSVTLTASSVTAGTYNWYDSALGGSLVQANSASFTTPVLNTTTTYYVTFTPDGQTCPSPRVAVTAAIGAFPTPTLGTITQPTCATPTTGSVNLTNLPNGGTLSQNNGTSTTEISYSGTTATVSLGLGTYTFTVSNGSCVSAASANVAILPLVTNTWNGSSWSPNIPTDALHLDQNIVFEGNYSANKDLYGCSCEVKSGAVVIHENYTMKVTNEVNVTGGSLTFLNTASLVQTNNVTNTGNITYKRKTPKIRPTDYVYWSSPVSGQTIADFSPTAGSLKYYYDLGWKAPLDTAEMAKGLGYIIRGQVASETTYDASFVGVPHNGPAPITANTPDKYYLVGNPYPSAIDADEFLLQNAGLDGNIYLWTHNTEIAKNAQGTHLVYTSDDYANYNFTGSTGTSKECISCTDAQKAIKPIGKIAAGQSFFVKTKAATTIQFNNDMRVVSAASDGNNNSQFFRTTNTNTTKSKTAVVEKHRLWLNLTNDQGAFKQTLIGYVTGATNDLDARYDGPNFNGNSFINFYSINQNKNYTIQGRALPFDQNDEVALGFKSTMKGSFTIAIDEVDGLLANQAVFIEDKLKGATFNLKTGNYTFDTEIGTFNERFVIRYTDKTLATQDFTIDPNTVLVSVKNKQIKVNAGETIDKVVVYDLLGKQIYTKTAVNSNELVVSNLVSGQQALVVKVVLQNGSSSTKKIVY